MELDRRRWSRCRMSYGVTICHMNTAKRLDVAAIGRRLMERREHMRLAQDDLAERASLSRAYISRLERGVVPNPKLVDLAQVAEALGMSVAELTMPPPEPGEDIERRRIIARHVGPDNVDLAEAILERMRNKPRGDLEKVAEVVEVLLSGMQGNRNHDR